MLSAVFNKIMREQPLPQGTKLMQQKLNVWKKITKSLQLRKMSFQAASTSSRCTFLHTMKTTLDALDLFLPFQPKLGSPHTAGKSKMAIAHQTINRAPSTSRSSVTTQESQLWEFVNLMSSSWFGRVTTRKRPQTYWI